MLHFILGPSGSGKSYQMLAELRTRAERGERSILIVPEQFTSSTEGVLYRTLGDSLSAYVDSYSFTSLSEALLRRYGGAAVPTLTEAGRALLLRRAADSLLDKVVYYSRQRRSAAFCEKAAQTISELKSAGVTPEMLAEYAKTPGADREKLDELAKNLTGKELKSGDVKVSGKSTGSYTVRADSKDGKTATALWQNDTAVFEVTGSKESVLRFYEPFPL